MTHDPIIEELRAERDAIAKGHDYDVAAIFAALRELETRSQREHVSLHPRRRVAVSKAVQQAAAADGGLGRPSGPPSDPRS